VGFEIFGGGKQHIRWRRELLEVKKALAFEKFVVKTRHQNQRTLQKLETSKKVQGCNT